MYRFFVASALLLALAACAPAAYEQSGGSGMESQTLVDLHGCRIDDINCQIIYDGP